jgi:hypothetical protein
MLAERFIVRTDRDGRLSGLPFFPPNEEIEVILLRKETVKSPLPKQISQKLRGSATWRGNDTSPVYEAAELDEIEAEMEKEWRELYEPGTE